MEQRTCPTCGASFTPTHWNQRFCPPTEEDRAKKAKPISRCARQWETARYQATATETVACKYCGQDFTRPRQPGRKVYCSDACHREAKCERFSVPRTHRVAFPPGVTVRDVAEYRRVLRRDPCAYCGERSDPSTVDHIEPTNDLTERRDWTNWTGACKRCNETKRALPLLL